MLKQLAISLALLAVACSKANPKSICQDLQGKGLVRQCAEGTIDLLEELPRYKSRQVFLPMGDDPVKGTVMQFETADDLAHASSILAASNDNLSLRARTNKERLDALVNAGSMSSSDALSELEKDTDKVVRENHTYYVLPGNILIAVSNYDTGKLRDELTRSYGYPK